MIDRTSPLWHTPPVDSLTEQDIAHALDVLGLIHPFTVEDLERAKRVQLYTWNPSRYAGLTNNPTQYTQEFRKAEEMTKTVEAAYALISTVFIPDDSDQ